MVVFIMRCLPRLFLVSFLIAVLMGGTPALAQDTKLQVLCQGDEALAKLDSPLLQMRQELQANKSAPLVVMQRYAPHAIYGSKLQCVIGMSMENQDIDQACSAANLQVMGKYQYPGIHAVVVQCSDPRNLEPIARRLDVRGIAVESGHRTLTGLATSQGDVSIHTNLARTRFSLAGRILDGRGVRVGVLSDSFADTRAGRLIHGILNGCIDQTLGDLPSDIRIIDPGYGGGTDEGNGMAQLIYDMAPRCEISFFTAAKGYFEFAEGITQLYADPTHPADVITDDVIYFVEPIYQNGPIATAANAAADVGVPYFSSAGNSGSDAIETQYVDSSGLDDSAFPPTGDDFHAFSTGDKSFTFTLPPPGGFVRAILKWDEPYGGVFAAGPGSQVDLDLYIANDDTLPLDPAIDGNIAASSTGNQGTTGSPRGEPYELLQASLIASDTVTYELYLDHSAGRKDVKFHLSIEIQGFSATSPPIVDNAGYLGARTIFGHAAGNKVMGVGAMNYQEIDAEGNFEGAPRYFDVESFSSKGGNLPFYFSDDGTVRLDPPLTVFKPDITGPDGTDTTFFGGSDSDDSGFPNFFGTSASAPHLAGVAALLKDLNPTASTADIYQVLIETARDIETPGRDTLSGNGLVDAYAALLKIQPSITPTPTITKTPTITRTFTVTYTPTPLPTPTVTNTPLVTRSTAQSNTGDAPVFVAAGKLIQAVTDDSQDAIQDVVVANSGGDSLTILLNDGFGGLPADATKELPLGEGARPSFVALEDLTNDFFKDILVVAEGTNQVLLFPNNGAGGFGPLPVVLPHAVDSPIAAFIADLNGDNLFDLAIPNTESDIITVVLATASGVTDPSAVVHQVPVGDGLQGRLPSYIAGGHVNAGMDLDLVSPNWEDGTVSVLLGNGDGTFQAAQILPAGLNPRSVVIADFDGASGNDIAVVNQGAPQLVPSQPGSLKVFFNDGAGHFGASVAVYTTGPSPMMAAPVDFNADNHVDLAVVNAGIPKPLADPPVQGDLTIYYNNGSGVFNVRDRFAPDFGDRPVALANARIDSTMYNDLVIADQQNDRVFVVNFTYPPTPKTHADITLDQVADALDLFTFSRLFGARDPRTRGIGDMSGDSVLDRKDVISFLQVFANEVPSVRKQSDEKTAAPDAPHLAAGADFNHDGVVDARDVLAAGDF